MSQKSVNKKKKLRVDQEGQLQGKRVCERGGAKREGRGRAREAVRASRGRPAERTGMGMGGDGYGCVLGERRAREKRGRE